MMNWKRMDRSVGRFAAWNRDPISTSAFWWKWDVERVRESASLLGPGLYREVRYESLIARPPEECAALCEFLGLPYDEAMLGFHEGRTKTKPGLDAKRAWLLITPGLRDWRSEMTAGEVDASRWPPGISSKSWDTHASSPTSQRRVWKTRQASRPHWRGRSEREPIIRCPSARRTREGSARSILSPQAPRRRCTAR